LLQLIFYDNRIQAAAEMEETMKKRNLMKMCFKKLWGVLSVSAIVMGLTACGGEAAAQSSGSQTEEVSEENIEETVDTGEQEAVITEAGNADFMEGMDIVFGQITSIDGDTLVIALAEQPSMGSREDNFGGGREDRKEGEAPAGSGEMPEGGMPEREMPEGEMPEIPEGGVPGGERPEGGMPDMQLTLTGETLTVEITDSVSIMMNGEEATLEELSVDDTVTVMMDGDTVVSVSAGLSRMGMSSGASQNQK